MNKIQRTRNQLESISLFKAFHSNWKPPREFPNLKGAKVIGLDLETYDPGLEESGPGWGIGNGHIVGVSLATKEGDSWYLPIRHEVQQEYNLDPDKVLNYLRDTLSTDCPKVGANLQYDVGWLNQENVQVQGPLYDVQYAEALIDDTAFSYSLDDISNKYLGQGKETNALYDWIKNAYGNTTKPRKDIYRSPPCFVGPYAEADAVLPIKILLLQWKELNKLGIIDLFKLECELIPILIKMRMRGMPVDEEKAEEAKKMIDTKRIKLQEQLNTFAGFDVNVYSSESIKQMFDAYNQEYPLTKIGNPSFTKDWLETNDFKGAQLIGNIRKYKKAVTSFIQGAILDKLVDGRIRPSLHPLRGEGGGTVSGRFSSNKPNGQQFSARDPELAPIIRGIFVPEPGLQWIKMDYSQIEYRFFAHFSNAMWLIEAYKEITADFHNVVREMLGFTGHRTPVKTVNFGILFGMRAKKLKAKLQALNLDIDAEKFLALYKAKFPEAEEQLQLCSEIAQDTGEIRTILNRRSTFNLFAPKGFKELNKPLPYEKALFKYGPEIERYKTYKALNRKIQGSAADMMKKAMVDAHEAGIFDRIGYPYITVHDELDNGYSEDMRKDFIELAEIMENCIKLQVPVLVDTEKGTSWGSLNSFNLRGDQ
jgi:DNA polymerase-1